MDTTCYQDFFVYPIICFIFVVQYPYKKEIPMIDWNIIVSQIATVAFDIVYFGAIISTIVVIILDNRNPVKTMAWILILLFLPIVGSGLFGCTRRICSSYPTFPAYQSSFPIRRKPYCRVYGRVYQTTVIVA